MYLSRVKRGDHIEHMKKVNGKPGGVGPLCFIDLCTTDVCDAEGCTFWDSCTYDGSPPCSFIDRCGDYPL